MKACRATLGLCLINLLAVPVVRLPATAASVPRVGDEAVRLVSGREELAVSLRCPRFIFEGGTAGGALPTQVKGSFLRGAPLEVLYPILAIGTNGQFEVRLLLQWSASEGVLRKWAEFRLVDAPAPLLLKEVILEQVDLAGQKPQLEAAGCKVIRHSGAASLPELSSRWRQRGWRGSG